MTQGVIADPSGHRVRLLDGARVVATTEGKLITLLPTLLQFDDQEALYPDFDKDSVYFWGSGVAPDPSDVSRYFHAESCITWITAQAQEYSDSTILAAAPDGVDFFVGAFRISRTTAPLSTWMGRSLSVLPIENQWMPIPGAASALLEADVGMARALHIYINGSNDLVLEVEQSVGNPPGYDSSFSSGSIGSHYGVGGVVHGGNGDTGTRRGLPIASRASKSYGYSTNPGGGPQSSGTNPNPENDYRWNGSSPCSRSDNTEYLSRYSIDIKGRWGRRS